MRFACQPVTADFFASAPLRFQHSAELPVPAERAFAVLEDEAAWPAWFNGIRQVSTDPDYGVGAPAAFGVAVRVGQRNGPGFAGTYGDTIRYEVTGQ